MMTTKEQANADYQPAPVVRCTGLDGRKWRGHYYRRVDGIWTCVNCHEPRP